MPCGIFGKSESESYILIRVGVVAAKADITAKADMPKEFILIFTVKKPIFSDTSIKLEATRCQSQARELSKTFRHTGLKVQSRISIPILIHCAGRCQGC